MTVIETENESENQKNPSLKLTNGVEVSTIMNRYDVIVVGGGVAGLSAGLYASRDGFSTLVLEGDFVSATEMPGGALLLTPEIENFPGFPGGAGGELIATIKAQTAKFGANIVRDLVEDITFATEKCGLHTIKTLKGQVYEAKTVILATGAVARQLGVEGEADFIGRGVSTCATCDGFFFEGKRVVVVGGGDTAVEDALFLRRYASEVTMLVRGDSLRSTGPEAREAYLLSEEETSNFNILWNTSVSAINNNDENVTSVSYVVNGEEGKIETDGVFVAIGRDPSTAFLHNSEGVELDSEGYIVVEDNSNEVKGNSVGVFAAGDAVDKKFRQAITSAGRAVEAALQAREYLMTAKRNCL
jgi:thioredoxin reductase (NADPH)